MSLKLTTAEFIAKAKAIHGNKYDYSKAVYAGCYGKVILICKKHGEFLQTPSNHLLKSKPSGCKKCFEESRTLGTDGFIRRAKSVHGSRYGYEKVAYVNNSTNVTITCKIHGDFSQKPDHHLSGYGCKKCNSVWDTETFIKEALAAHGNKYDYSKVEYVTSRSSVVITCPSHGEFRQSPNNHLNGQGCKQCSKIGYSKIAIRWIEREAFSRRMKNIQHAGNGGEYRIPNTRLKVDGYHAATNTVFEFYGDAYHGNPARYPPNSTPHPHMKGKTARQLYRETIKREQYLKSLGYKVVSVWEKDFRDLEKKRNPITVKKRKRNG